MDEIRQFTFKQGFAQNMDRGKSGTNTWELGQRTTMESNMLRQEQSNWKTILTKQDNITEQYSNHILMGIVTEPSAIIFDLFHAIRPR